MCNIHVIDHTILNASVFPDCASDEIGDLFLLYIVLCEGEMSHKWNKLICRN